jgi:hypothetical protein
MAGVEEQKVVETLESQVHALGLWKIIFFQLDTIAATQECKSTVSISSREDRSPDFSLRSSDM